MSVSGINFSGLGTGIDTESIIQQLIKLDQRPITVLQARQQQLQQQQAAVNQVAASVSSLQAAASVLTASTGFTAVQGSSSDASVASVTAETGAQPGSHSLQVLNLARAQKVAGIALGSQTDPLGASGQIVVNGKGVSVAATDSLQTLVAAINAARAGVNASIVSTATNSYTLVLTSAGSGVQNAISLSDTADGTILQNTLGIVGASLSIRSPIANGAASSLFADSSTSVGTLLGLTAPQAGDIQIDGTSVHVDFATDSLTDIAGKINAAGITGVTASVVSAPDPVSGTNREQLQITGASTPALTDASNILTGLGILQNALSNELVAARDAAFTLDGLGITRSSNTVSDVLSGVTINLLEDAGQPTTEISVSADTDRIRSNIQTFVNQYNQVVKTFGSVASFDPETLTGGPLFGDVTIQNIVNSLTDIVTGTVSGLSGTNSLAALGITLDQSNSLNIDDAMLSNALSNDLSAAAKVFQAIGTASESGVTYISSSEKTKPSSGSGYAIDVTQVATRPSVSGGVPHTADDNPDVEVLTFRGNAFGAAGKTLLLNANSTLADIVSQINSDATLSNILSAADVGGYLALTSKQYGSAQSFTVVSSQAAAANNSGIGLVPLDANGEDAAGTIGGEAATGNGQFLTGTAGNARTDGLQIRVTTPTTGAHGSLVFTRGIASVAGYYANDATDALSGSLSLYANSLGDQATGIGDTIGGMQASLNDEETRLREQFAAMESAVAQLRAAGSGLSGLMATSFFSSGGTSSGASSTGSS